MYNPKLISHLFFIRSTPQGRLSAIAPSSLERGPFQDARMSRITKTGKSAVHFPFYSQKPRKIVAVRKDVSFRNRPRQHCLEAHNLHVPRMNFVSLICQHSYLAVEKDPCPLFLSKVQTCTRWLQSPPAPCALSSSVKRQECRS